MSWWPYSKDRNHQGNEIMSVAGVTGEVMKNKTVNSCIWNIISWQKDLTEYLCHLKKQNAEITEN
jgi:hypothetical protein